MPKIVSTPKNICLHNDIHPKWIAQGQHIAVCAMAKPYLINCIDMLQRTLDEAYPFVAQLNRSPLTQKEIKQTQDQLRMLQTELQRRNES